MIDTALATESTPRMPSRGPRVALAHDWLVGLRGGERVLDRLAQRYGPTDIYTLVSNGAFLTDAIAECRVITSVLQRLPGAAGSARRHYLPLMPWAVNRLRVASCDLLISTSSCLIKSVLPPPNVPHLCYCHSPARYLWEQMDDYAVGRGGLTRRIGLGLTGPSLRRWDRRTAHRVTRFLANSAHTAARVRRCFDREAVVVYPPVRTEHFTPDPATSREDWMLLVSALEPYKRTDLAIDAANAFGFRLKVVGTGSQRGMLRSRAGRNVELLGHVDDDRLRDLLRRARGLVFPQVEDFGIIAVEAQATGCPVVAFLPPDESGAGVGGAAETVTAETGVFFREQSPDAIAAAVHELSHEPRDPAACRKNAERFSEDAFDEAIAAQVDDLLARR